jgi:TIR domain
VQIPPFALRLVEDLKTAGVNIWLDQLDIDAGAAWDRAVEDALFRCPSMLVILSDVSVNSEHVRDEISFALSRQKRILPVLYRDCEIPFRLARLQRIDFRTDYAHGLRMLCRALGVPEMPATRPPAPAPETPDFISSTKSELHQSSRVAFRARIRTRLLALSPALWIPACALSFALLRQLATLATFHFGQMMNVPRWIEDAVSVAASAILLSVMLLWLKPELKPKHAIRITSAWVGVSILVDFVSSVVFVKGVVGFYGHLFTPASTAGSIAVMIHTCEGLILGLVLAAALKERLWTGVTAGVVSFAIPALFEEWFLQYVFDGLHVHRGNAGIVGWIFGINVVAWSISAGAFLGLIQSWDSTRHAQ